MRIPKRFSLATFFTGFTLVCLLVGYIGYCLQVRRHELKTAGILIQAGVHPDAISWGVNSDIVESVELNSEDFVSLRAAKSLWVENDVSSDDSSLGYVTRYPFERVLGIEYVESIDIGNREFAAIKKFRDLKWLSLASCSIEDSVFEKERLPGTLVSLWMSGTSLNGMNSHFFSDAVGLEILYLYDCDVTDAMLDQITALSRLRFVLLSGNLGITDSGVKKLAQLKNLESLSLSYTSVSRHGIRALTELQNLRYVELIGTQIQTGDIADIRTALPKTRFRIQTDTFHVE